MCKFAPPPFPAHAVSMLSDEQPSPEPVEIFRAIPAEQRLRPAQRLYWSARGIWRAYLERWRNPVARFSSSQTSKTAGHSERRPIMPSVREVKSRSEEHTSELQSLRHLVCRLLLEKK